MRKRSITAEELERRALQAERDRELAAARWAAPPEQNPPIHQVPPARNDPPAHIAASNESRNLWIGIAWGAAVTSVATLLALSAPEYAVVLLFVLSGTALTAACWLHGWFNGSTLVLRAIRIVLFSSIAWGTVLLCGYRAWPTVEVSPDTLDFVHNGVMPGETRIITVTNNKPRDVFNTNVSIDFHAKVLNDFKFDVPSDSRHELAEGQRTVNGLKIADMKGYSCGDNRLFYLNIYRLRPHEFRELTITHIKNSPCHTTLKVYTFTTDSTMKIVGNGQLISPFTTGSYSCSEPWKIHFFYY